MWNLLRTKPAMSLAAAGLFFVWLAMMVGAADLTAAVFSTGLVLLAGAAIVTLARL